jgi:uncharacterized protein YeaO (DUF488 family)
LRKGCGMAIKIKRAYEPPSKSDGTRILIDGLWPRGVSREKAAIAEWMKEVAVSAALRKWFSHDPAKWPEFKKRYRAELAGKPAAAARLREMARHGTLTIVYAAKDEERNNAVVLKEFLENRSGKP